MTHYFVTSWNVGNQGEEEFRKNWTLIHPELTLTHPNDQTHDFLILETGQSVELKTDTYDPEKTPNFFMERYSDINNQSPGGPWRAREHGISLFVYFFPKGRIWYEFWNVPHLVDTLDELTKNQSMFNIRNHAWTTGGFKVDRESIKNMWVKCELPTI